MTVDLAVAIPIILSVATAVVVAFRRILTDFATIIRLQTEMKEKISLAQVGIECLGIVDQDTKNRLQLLEQRAADIERYLQLQTAEFERPFLIRQNYSNNK